ncbi:DUF815 domain-containing protein [Helicobacter cappadocius]|uniref:DUF815 domain-containing protein n=1 Tax=Helicobacter cappadocius TaxID=3063998 RepID=A0AA90PJF8_9HELI|nr:MULTISPECIES: DUF815 domain-containing protein [unclassified Helicobacter]MDO7253445.1 DUF815 domain-containing protein [Helicobacter sp. faydin-H75]MDP2539372.1 DUF815 domain-containing protein [Helicobacter sp. faydin-H76]
MNTVQKINLECNWNEVKACVFRNYNGGYFHPIKDFDRLDTKDLLGLDKEISNLEKNTLAFCEGKIASNVLIWGARGCGKSSIVKGVLSSFIHSASNLRVIEVEKVDIWVLPLLMDILRESEFLFIIYCDDLSFEAGDSSYKSLKSVLEGSLEKIPKNVLMYATSNRRHLIAEAQEVQEIHQKDVYDEIISLSDRFGLSMGIYTLGSDEYLSIVKSLCENEDEFKAVMQLSLNYAGIKGNRSGRSAKEFYKLYKNGIFDK